MNFKQYITENEENPYSSLQGKVFAFELPSAAFGKGKTCCSEYENNRENMLSNPAQYVEQDICVKYNNKNFCFMISGIPKIIIKITDPQKLFKDKNRENSYLPDFGLYAEAYDIVDIEILNPNFVGHWLKTSNDNTPDWDIIDKDEHADGDENKANMLRYYIKSEGISYIRDCIIKTSKWAKGMLELPKPEEDECWDVSWPILTIVNNKLKSEILTKFHKNVRVNYTGDLPVDENV